MLGLGTGIAAFGWLVRSAVGSVNSRLDRLEMKLSEIVSQVNVSVARQDVNTVEIDKLRVTVHSLQSDVAALDAVQGKCRSCNPRY
jgi:septation ring formation regulator EzrA